MQLFEGCWRLGGLEDWMHGKGMGSFSYSEGHRLWEAANRNAAKMMTIREDAHAALFVLLALT